MTCAEKNSEILSHLPPIMCYSIYSGQGRGPGHDRGEHTMTKHSNERFVVFDNDMNCNIFDIETMTTEGSMKWTARS